MLPPIWLLDFDGVINVTRPGWGGPPHKANVIAAGEPWPIRWAPTLVDRIRRLHLDEVVEVRWCSTWCAYADVLEDALRLPSLGRAFTEPLNGNAAVLAKTMAASAVLDVEGRRLVWTDDEVVPHSGDLFDEQVADGRALLIAPKPNCGLQPDDLERIEAFAKESAAGKPAPDG